MTWKHLKHMAEVRPGQDGETSRWAIDEITRLNLLVSVLSYDAFVSHEQAASEEINGE